MSWWKQERQEKGLLGREMFGAGGGHMDGAYRDAIDGGDY